MQRRPTFAFGIDLHLTSTDAGGRRTPLLGGAGREFDAVPVMVVVRAIVTAHAQLEGTAAEWSTPEFSYAIRRERLA
jgi:hypothetical protein